MSLKDMASGAQELVGADEAAGKILAGLAAVRSAAPIKEPEQG